MFAERDNSFVRHNPTIHKGTHMEEHGSMQTGARPVAGNRFHNLGWGETEEKNTSNTNIKSVGICLCEERVELEEGRQSGGKWRGTTHERGKCMDCHLAGKTLTLKIIHFLGKFKADL